MATNWLDEFERGRLRSAYDLLAESLDPYHIAARGHVACLLLEHEQAADLFKLAAAMWEQIREISPRIIYRSAIANAFSLEFWILSGRPISPMEAWTPRLRGSSPLIRAADSIMQATTARYLLHAGEAAKALSVFRRLARASGPRIGEPASMSTSAGWKILMSCALVDLGHYDAAMKSAESAGWLAALVETPFPRAALASRLTAFYSACGDADAAGHWRSTLAETGVPDETIDALLRRSALSEIRSGATGRCVVL